jgi:hypothetical protein
MDWVYGGYLTAWYVVLGIGFALALPTHSDPWMAALAFFLLIPGLIVMCSGLGDDLIAQKSKAAVDRAVQRGSLSRGYTFATGLAAAVASMAGIVLVGCTVYPFQHHPICVVLLLFGSAAVLAASFHLGVWWLARKCASQQPS